MKSLLLHTLLLTATCISPLVAQVNSENSNAHNKNLQAVNNRFSNLPQDKRDKYIALRQDAYRYFNNKRTFEAMTTLYEMVEIFDEDPQTYNLLGSIHIEFRNFDKARSTFEHALKIAVGDNMLLFNLAEIEFCSSNWELSLKRFQQVKEQTKEQAESDLSNLIDLKVMLCHLALADEEYKETNKSQKASNLAEAKKLLNKRSYLDDSCSNSVC